MAREDYYSILGVDKHAPEREIKRAYYKLARDLHPDKASNPEEARVNAEKLAVISKAYNTLKDPKKRTAYDGGAPSTSADPATATDVAADPPSQGAAKGAPPSAAAAARTPRADPATRGGGSKSPANGAPQSKVSASDIASQRVVTAQKAFVKGMEYYKNADYRKALPFFEAAVKNDPEGEAQYHMKLATCLMKTKGSFSRAVQAAETAATMDQYNMDYRIALADIYETVGITSKAMTVYEEVLKWDNDNQKAKNRLELLRSQEAQKNPNLLAKIFPSIFGKK